jgi:hypothetical protein
MTGRTITLAAIRKMIRVEKHNAQEQMNLLYLPPLLPPPPSLLPRPPP